MPLITYVVASALTFYAAGAYYIEKLKKYNEKPPKNVKPNKKKQAQKKSDGRVTPKIMAEHTLPNGLIIQIVSGNIINEKCDAIINQSSAKLHHGGGELKNIGVAAGLELIKECKDYINTYGELQIGDVFVTNSGELEEQFPHVIHVVGPRISNNNYKKLLNIAIINVLNTADGKNCKIISIPAISSGNYGVNNKEVAEIFLWSLLSFDQQNSSRILKTVRLTNLDTDITNTFLKQFEEKMMSISKDFNKYCEIFGDFQIPQDPDNYCVICQYDIDIQKSLSCGHKYCRSCIDQHLLLDGRCPICRELHHKQPEGEMVMLFKIQRRNFSCSGSYPVASLSFNIPGGIQTNAHPNPGLPFKGIDIIVYLPYSQRGQDLTLMLHRAFNQKMLFTVGTCDTTGEDNKVITNDIHLKTDISKRDDYYPDTNYMDILTAELASKGIFTYH